MKPNEQEKQVWEFDFTQPDKMKTIYLNGLSKVMIGLYGAAIMFGPPSIALSIADVCSNGEASLTTTRVICSAGTVWVLGVCPFVMIAATRKWRHLLVQIVEQ